MRISFPLLCRFRAFNAPVRRCDACSGEEHWINGCKEVYWWDIIVDSRDVFCLGNRSRTSNFPWSIKKRPKHLRNRMHSLIPERYSRLHTYGLILHCKTNTHRPANTRQTHTWRSFKCMFGEINAHVRRRLQSSPWSDTVPDCAWWVGFSKQFKLGTRCLSGEKTNPGKHNEC